MGFEILPHTADLRIRAWGRTIEELFRDSLLGMSAVLQPAAAPGNETIERRITLEAPDVDSLLIDFLSEALSLSEINREIYTSVQFPEFKPDSLTATLRGVQVGGFDKDIKAVTYHEAVIRRTGEGYEATVIYDI